ncbi:LysM peptidoglycan-binding domain-containing protein [Microvirga sp. BT688]|uniref:LysM peptidoglycan-binding domain-containing protein n=1 Tax=Microvirga sp. TaxID=1873136 RepID=UPI001685E402|nr:LysM domain-containing protein [Microvirga sp.]MBD2749920.1 LysM peptidoglycan-binding domain-containing protein [Microvirga sp.]
MSSAAQARGPDKCDSAVLVSRGDTLSSLARRCGTTVSALMGANPHIRDPDLLQVGTALSLAQDIEDKDFAEPVVGAIAHSIAIEPSTLTPGAPVMVRASSLPPGARVWIKGGNSRSPKHHLVLQGARVDTYGNLSVTLRVPKWLKVGDSGFTLSVEVPYTGLTLSSDVLQVKSRYATDDVR